MARWQVNVTGEDHLPLHRNGGKAYGCFLKIIHSSQELKAGDSFNLDIRVLLS